MFYMVSFESDWLFFCLMRKFHNYCFPILAPRKRSDAFSQTPERPNCTWVFEKTPGMVKILMKNINENFVTCS